jgi:hypothetical protein
VAASVDAAEGTTRILGFAMSPARMGRFALALTFFGAAMHYLVSGRKESNFSKMIVGAVLALLSMLVL